MSVKQSLSDWDGTEGRFGPIPTRPRARDVRTTLPRIVHWTALTGKAGQPVDIDGSVITEFELPITELDLLRPTTDTAGVLAGQTRFIGRPAAQALGKALFWDMQVGSDGVQACGTCHFHATVDNRTKNQLNPNHLGGDFTLHVHSGPNQELVASDFPFRRLDNLDGPSETPGANGLIVSHAVREGHHSELEQFLAELGPVAPLERHLKVAEGRSGRQGSQAGKPDPDQHASDEGKAHCRRRFIACRH